MGKRQEPVGVRSATISARAATIAAIIACGGAIIVAVINRAYTKQTSEERKSQTVSGERNVVAQGQQITVNVSGGVAVDPSALSLEATWLSEIRYLSPTGVDFRGGIGSMPANGIVELLQRMYGGRTKDSYGSLREYRDRVIKVNPHFGYVNWLWGRILKTRFQQSDEAKEAFREAIKQLKAAAAAAPESPYPPFYMALVHVELGDDELSDWYFEQALNKSVHLCAEWMLPVEFEPRDLRNAATYSRWSAFWSLWLGHAQSGNSIKPCDMTTVWAKEKDTELPKWRYTYEDGKWVHHIELTVNLPSFPDDQADNHYVDTAFYGKGTLMLFDSFASAREYYGVRLIRKEEESTKICDLPNKVTGFGDPLKHFFPFLNDTKDGLVSTKKFPYELEIIKMSNTNYFYLGYCSTNDLADGVIRLFLDGPSGCSTNVLALPWNWVGENRYKRPDRQVADKDAQEAASISSSGVR